MAKVGKKHTVGASGSKTAPATKEEYAGEVPQLATSFDAPTSGIPGNSMDMAEMLGRDGKWLMGGELPCYATGRTDRAAPPFPGVGGNLRGAVSKRR